MGLTAVLSGHCLTRLTPPGLPRLQVLIGTLTVYETIMYSAKLRLPQVGRPSSCAALQW